MEPLVVVAVVVLLLPLVVLTAVGQHRRTSSLGLALVAGLCSPLAWATWYARDELPVRRPA